MTPSTAADLVGAALLSTLIFPVLGLRLRRAPRPQSGEPGSQAAAVAQRLKVAFAARVRQEVGMACPADTSDRKRARAAARRTDTSATVAGDGRAPMPVDGGLGTSATSPCPAGSRVESLSARVLSPSKCQNRRAPGRSARRSAPARTLGQVSTRGSIPAETNKRPRRVLDAGVCALGGIAAQQADIAAQALAALAGASMASSRHGASTLTRPVNFATSGVW